MFEMINHARGNHIIACYAVTNPVGKIHQFAPML
jgi:hypothetical protein